MKCPLCDKYLCDGDSISERDFYNHINSASDCSERHPICPECGMEFAQFRGDRPWRRFASHWMRYGHLHGPEHSIAAGLGGEISLEEIIRNDRE